MAAGADWRALERGRVRRAFLCVWGRARRAGVRCPVFRAWAHVGPAGLPWVLPPGGWIPRSHPLGPPAGIPGGSGARGGSRGPTVERISADLPLPRGLVLERLGQQRGGSASPAPSISTEFLPILAQNKAQFHSNCALGQVSRIVAPEGRI